MSVDHYPPLSQDDARAKAAGLLAAMVVPGDIVRLERFEQGWVALVEHQATGPVDSAVIVFNDGHTEWIGLAPHAALAAEQAGAEPECRAVPAPVHPRRWHAAKLTGLASRAVFAINRTAVHAAERIAAIADTAFLTEIARHDTRGYVLTAVLDNHLVPLEAVLAIWARYRDSSVVLWWGSISRALTASAARHAAVHGGPATLALLFETMGSTHAHEEALVIAALPEARVDASFVAELIDRDPTLVTVLIGNGLTLCSVEVVRTLAQGPLRFAETIANDPALCSRDPELVELFFARCIQDGSNRACLLAAAIAQYPLSPAQFAELGALAATMYAGAASVVLDALARNELCPSDVVAHAPVVGLATHRGTVARRLATDRRGDEPAVVDRCVELSERFTGSYAELVDAAAAS